MQTPHLVAEAKICTRKLKEEVAGNKKVTGTAVGHKVD